jgi:hypothetical protein
MCDHDQASRGFLCVPNVDRRFSRQILHFIRQSNSEISLEKKYGVSLIQNNSA